LDTLWQGACRRTGGGLRHLCAALRLLRLRMCPIGREQGKRQHRSAGHQKAGRTHEIPPSGEIEIKMKARTAYPYPSAEMVNISNACTGNFYGKQRRGAATGRTGAWPFSAPQ